MSESAAFLNKKTNRPANNMSENLNLYQFNPNQMYRESGKIYFF